MLTAALALVALPGLAGSRAPSPIEPLPVSAFQQLPIPANALAIDGRRSDRSTTRYVSAGAVDARRHRSSSRATAPDVTGPTASADASTSPSPGAGDRPSKPPKYTLTGGATFYDNGTTAMRLPRGTIVVICGDGGCIERVVNDYGPARSRAGSWTCTARLLRDLRLRRRGPGTTDGDGLRLLTGPPRAPGRGILAVVPSATAP